MKGTPPKPGYADIELCSGDFLNLADPEPSVITIDVIAHHLARVCRYAGATRRNFSVGEHSLLVAAYLEFNGYPPNVVLGGLHHDDAEAFIGDVTRPLKELLPSYYVIEEKMENAVSKALGFEELGIDVHSSEIKQADNWAMATEAYYLMPTRGEHWWSSGLFHPFQEVSKILEVLQLTDFEPSNIVSSWKWRHIDLMAKTTKVVK